jgi:hypothetical protein
MARIIDGPVSQNDLATRMIDKYYKFDLTVSADQYDIVYSYFYSESLNKNTAANFTTMLFRISSITGKDALELLEYIKGKSKIQVNTIMAYYLNSMKSKTTLYGVNVIPPPNQTVQRNIVI